jgi:hypothetical protein
MINQQHQVVGVSGVNGGNFFGGKGGKGKVMVDEEGGGTERKNSEERRGPKVIERRWRDPVVY